MVRKNIQITSFACLKLFDFYCNTETTFEKNKKTWKFRSKARCREAYSGHWHKLFEIIFIQNTIKIIQHSMAGYVPCLRSCIYNKIDCGPISIKHSSHVVCTISSSWLCSSSHYHSGTHYELWLKLYYIYFKKHASWIPWCRL
jgi:hypothetical protein